MKIALDAEEKVNFLVSASQKMGVSADDILAVYLLLGDEIFFLFDLFQGRSVKFPSMRGFHHILSLVGKTEVVRLDKHHYIINGVDSYKEDIVQGDLIEIDGVTVMAMSSPMVYLGGSYILIKKEGRDL